MARRRNFKPKKSFADIVRNQPKLSGANRVSIGSRNFQNSNPVRIRSVFDRISWPREMYRNWGSRLVNRPSTRWESVKSRDSYHEPTKWFASQGNRGFSKFQILNSWDKGKKMATGESDQQLFWPCLNCAKFGWTNMICKSWTVYFQCGKRGMSKGTAQPNGNHLTERL
jgi:hypothetical protein